MSRAFVVVALFVVALFVVALFVVGCASAPAPRPASENLDAVVGLDDVLGGCVSEADADVFTCDGFVLQLGRGPPRAPLESVADDVRALQLRHRELSIVVRQGQRDGRVVVEGARRPNIYGR